MFRNTLIFTGIIIGLVLAQPALARTSMTQSVLDYDSNTGFIVHCDNFNGPDSDRIAIYGPIDGHDGVFLKSDLNYCDNLNHNVQTDFNPVWTAGTYHFEEYDPTQQVLPFPQFLEDQDQVNQGSIGDVAFNYNPTATVPQINLTPTTSVTLPNTFTAACNLGRDLIVYGSDNSLVSDTGACSQTEFSTLQADTYLFVVLNRTTNIPQTSTGALADVDFITSATYAVLPPPAPTLTFSTNPTTINQGASATLTWSTTNADSCTATGAWTGNQTATGSLVVSPAATSTYTLTCTGAGGSVSQSVTVTVTAVTPQPKPCDHDHDQKNDHDRKFDHDSDKDQKSDHDNKRGDHKDDHDQKHDDKKDDHDTKSNKPEPKSAPNPNHR